MFTHRPGKSPVIVYAAFAALLFGYVVLRAVFVGFTHDEAITFSILNGETHLLTNSTNHWLNTVLTFLSFSLLGDDEWALRLPNVLSFAVYLYFMYRLFITGSGKWLPVLAGMAIAIANPFVLEFFSLCRGYGLSMACLAGALYEMSLLLEGYRAKRYRYFAVFIILAVYANYSFIYCLALVQVAYLFLFWKNDREKPHRKSLIRITAVQALFLVPAMINLIRLITRHQLYFGGDDNIFSDTFYSLAARLFPQPLFKAEPVLFLVILVFTFIPINRLAKTKMIFRHLAIVMFFLVVIPSVLHLLAGVKYPIERTAMYWMPLFGLYLHRSGNEILAWAGKTIRNGSRIAYVIVVLVIGHSLVSTANISFTWTWRFDAHTRDMLKVLETKADESSSVSLGIHWIFEPVVNYYREKESHSWLEPVTREGYIDKEFDFYYVFRNEADSIPVSCIRELAMYDISFSCLLENCRNTGR